MRYLVLLLFPALAYGQIATYDSRTEAKPDWRPVVDLADRDRLTNPDFALWMLQWATPALIDRETMIAVRITGTVAQAKATLDAETIRQLPAIVRERGVDVKDEARAIRSRIASERGAAGGQGTVLLLRARVIALMTQTERQAELIEQLQERVEMLEQRD